MDLEIDAIGLLCPLPVLRLRKRMEPLNAGAKIRLLADDPAAIIDVPHFCSEAGHAFVSMTETDGHLEFIVQKG
ncbi:sulfurtransferase TusA family protein [uncultured Shimia sp.]|uniref:sulfurtransferase TusA family protein n=1 Tax=uncultured Shimia sp. TaxID=573152 RepID=UPI0025FB9C94|nr:sulfurtransferase TusA family protein [uncultured Shimia sp.]